MKGDSIFINFIHFVLNLILAGFFLRFVQVKTSGTALGNALAYVY